MSERMTYDTLGQDGLAEIVDLALTQVIANINDPNTDHKKARELTIKLTIKPTGEDRAFQLSTYVVSSKLAPVKPQEISSMMDTDGKSLVFTSRGMSPDQHELPINVTNIKEARNG